MMEDHTQNELHTQIQYRLIEQLSESEQRYRKLIENLRDIIFTCDQDGKIIFLNQAWTKILGYSKEDSIGRLLNEFIDPRDQSEWPSFTDEFDSEKYIGKEFRFRDSQGQIVWLEVSFQTSESSQYSGSLFNITVHKENEAFVLQLNEQLEERVSKRTAELTKINQKLSSTLNELQQTQSRLLQSEKMTSLGQLVAGIAHEINNPMNFIHGNLTILVEYIQDIATFLNRCTTLELDENSKMQQAIEDLDLEFLQKDSLKVIESMQLGTDRIREIVLSLRNFSRIDESGLKKVDIHQGLDSTITILRHRFEASPDHRAILLKKDYGSLPLVTCHPGLINQVTMNILANAIDAVQDKYSPKQHEEGEGYIQISTCLKNKNSVSIKISDNGVGISESTRKKIFDPFFTTKEIGKGTGMGMAIAHQIIVEKHKGTIQCHSIPNVGTEFEIEIPLVLT
ncbi:MAG: PAS domain S-box protein [Coleofasciculaceae cyanobacterium RL_1_1]|nr:PAS domain S-box protein [Coleofasciculaceae cyanobacterium RL_1_1]